MIDKIQKINNLMLDLEKFPYEILAFSDNLMIKKWTYLNKDEAYIAHNLIWKEIYNTKKVAK